MLLYCINLARAPERWALMRDQATRLSLVIERVDAVDGQDPEQRVQLDNICRDGPLGMPGVGTLACTMSHYLVWQKIASGTKMAIVLEDDAVLADDFADVVSALEQGGMGEFDLVKMESSGAVRDGLVCGAAHPLTERRSVRPIFHLATGSAAYALTPKGAQQLIDRFEFCAVPVDHYLFYPSQKKGFGGLPCAIIDLPVAEQAAEMPSMISPTRKAHKQSLKAKLRRAYYEAAQAPVMLLAMARGARIRKLPYEP